VLYSFKFLREETDDPDIAAFKLSLKDFFDVYHVVNNYRRIIEA